jgi:hypothetical protein
MGIKKYIESPEILWGFFEQYRKETKSKPRKKHVFVGKDGDSKFEELEVPLTIEGFYEFVSYHKDTKFDTSHPDLSHYFENKDERYSDFVRICTRIRRAIRQDQIEGGMVGQYNPSITQRLNGLIDKQEINDNREPRVFNID